VNLESILSINRSRSINAGSVPVRRGEHVPAVAEEQGGNEDPTAESGLHSAMEREHGGI